MPGVPSLLFGIVLALLLAYCYQLVCTHPMIAGTGPLFQLGQGAGFDASQMPQMQGKTALITGANTGLGLASAEALLKAGATVLLACRTESKCAAAALDLRKAANVGAERVQVHLIDTADLRSVRACALSVREAHQRLDVLMLNAGVNRIGQHFAVANTSGAELTLATNHLGHFLLVDLLKSTLGEGSRVVVVSSAAHYFAPGRGVPLTKEEVAGPGFYVPGPPPPSLEHLLPDSQKSYGGPSSYLTVAFSKLIYRSALGGDDGRHTYCGLTAYSISKFANLLFAQELSARLRSAGAVVLAAHPGFVRTNMAETFFLDLVPAALKPHVMAAVDALFLHRTFGFLWSPETGAFAQLFAAAAPEAALLPPGSYLIPPGRLGTKDPRLGNLDAQRIFWDLSEELVREYRDVDR